MNFFLSNSRLALLTSLVFVFMGIRGLIYLQRETTPPVDFARVYITTAYPGASSAEVEELITLPIEEAIRPIDYIKKIRSYSQPGFSFIRIRIDIDQADTEQVANKLHQALQTVQGLPPEILDPPRLQHIDASKRRPVITLFVSSPRGDRLRNKASWRLKTNLEKIQGVSEIQMSNYRKRELSVLLSHDKMEQLHISADDALFALSQRSMDIPAGYLESDTKKLVRVPGKPRIASALENVIVRSNFSGQKVLIKDIAQVIDGSEKETQREYFYKPQKDTAYKLRPATSLSVLKTLKADTVALVSNIKRSIKTFQEGRGGGYSILIGFDDGENTKRRLLSVVSNGLTGLVIIFIVFLFCLPARVGFMVSWSLPLSVFGTLALFPVMGVSFNIITMLAFVICIGMLVDNSVVIAEYYSRLVSEGQKPPSTAAREAVRQFAKPITATVLTTIAAFLPMLATTGIMGEFIKWAPIVVTTALLMSLFESFCLLPNRLQWLSRKQPRRHQARVLSKLSQIENLFEIFIKKALVKKYTALGAVLALLVSTALVFKFGSRVDLFSSKNPELYTAYIEPKPNTALSIVDEEARRIAEKAQSVLGGEKTIQWMSVKASAEQANILIRVKPSVLKRIKYKDILKKLRKIDKGDLETLSFGALVGGPPIGKPLRAAIQSNNRQKIREFIDEISPEIKKIPGLINLKSEPVKNRGTEYNVQTHSGTLARLGLSFRSVGSALRTALEGQIVTELTENNESFYIRLKYDKQMSSLEDLKKIKIKERFGRLISLSEVAEIQEIPSEPYRVSYNFEPVVFLQADINPAETTSMKVNAKAKKIIESKIKKHPSITFKMIGEQETTEESLRSLFRASALAVFAIFIILIILFKSFLLSFLILSCVPLGLVGVVWSFFLHQRALNFFALIGVVGLAGVVVNSAIILISFILKLKQDEPESSFVEIVAKASKMRFRPIMITNLTTLGGLWPTAYGIAGFEPMLIPMTLALFWGLFSAAVLTLIWVPCAVLAIQDGERLASSLWKKWLAK